MYLAARCTRVGLRSGLLAITGFLALAGTLWSGPLGHAQQGVTLTRGPYLQALVEDSVTVIWTTDVPSPTSSVRYTPADRPQDAITLASADTGTRHEVDLIGLEAGTTYDYEVLAAGQVLATGPTFRFRTAPPFGSGSFRAVVVGDSGDEALEFQGPVTTLVESLEPDLFLHTGDLLYTGTYDQVVFQEYRPLLASVGLYAARGNHSGIQVEEWFDFFSPPDVLAEIVPCELPEDICSEPVDAPIQVSDPRAATFYSFDWGPAHFAVLDSNTNLEPCGKQIRWLCADLSAARARGAVWLVLMMHHPVYTAGAHSILDFETTLLIPSIAEKFGVDLVLSGHDHNYQRTYPLRQGVIVEAWQEPSYVSPAGTVYVVTGGGGTRLYGRLPRAPHRFLFKAFESVHHATQLDVSPTEMRVQALRTDGSLIDTFTLSKEGPARQPGFLGGDTTLDGSRDITDGIELLNVLFLDSTFPCPAAFEAVGDVNRSGDVDIGDPVSLFNFLFLGGPAPAAPFAECETIPGLEQSTCFGASCGI